MENDDLIRPPGSDIIKRYMGREISSNDDTALLRLAEYVAIVARMVDRLSQFNSSGADSRESKSRDTIRETPPSL